MKYFIPILLYCASLAFAAEGQLLDISKVVVVAPANSNRQEQKAVQMLVDEIAVRTQIRPLISQNAAADGIPMIVLARQTGPAEGYHISLESSGSAAKILVTGNDSRGLLFGVGRLLRTLRLSRQKIELASDIKIDTAPKASLRGHQLGYRPKTNSYDGWTVAMWEQYIRDLTVFGINAIELIPPRSDDLATSPHFPIPQMQMMSEMSRLAE